MQTCSEPPPLEGTLQKETEQPKFCVANLLTTTAQQPSPTQCFTEAVHRPGSSPYVFTVRPKATVFVSALSSEEPRSLCCYF